MDWTGWPLERGVLLLTGLLFLGIFTQVTMFHSRQNFRFPSQWVPVVATPVLGVLALLLVASPSPAVRAVFAPLLWVGAGAGVYGGVVHFLGVGQRVEGYTGYNFLVGPPIVLPLTITLVSLLGLLALRRMGMP